jgi:hypothetical protein
VGPGAALQAMGCMELTPAAEAVQAMAGAGVQALAMAGAADGGAGAKALGSNFQAAPVPAEQPTGTAALPSSQVLDSSSAPEPTQAAAAAVGRLVAADGLPVPAGIDAGHTTLLQESLTGSQGWSTLTAGSSSGSVGSEQLSNLVQEQLQASHSAGAVDFPDRARPVTGLETDAGEPAAPAQGLASHQAREVQLEHQLANGSTEVAVVQQQAYSTAGQIGGMQPGQPEAVDNGTAGALLAPADEVAAALVTSEQRLQQLLSQDDDAVLLMSFALKLDRLGRTYKGPSQASAVPLLATATTGPTDLHLTRPLACYLHAHMLLVGAYGQGAAVFPRTAVMHTADCAAGMSADQSVRTASLPVVAGMMAFGCL